MGILTLLKDLQPTSESIPNASLKILEIGKLKSKEEINELIKDFTLAFKESSKDDHILSMLYLINDILQKSYQLNFSYFKEAFTESVLMYFQVGYHKLKSKEIKKKVLTILDVWIKRKVYSENFVNKIIESCRNKELNKEELVYLNPELIEYGKISKELNSKVQKTDDDYTNLLILKEEIESKRSNNDDFQKEKEELEMGLRSLKNSLDDEKKARQSHMMHNTDMLKGLDVIHLRFSLDLKSLQEKEEKIQKILNQIS